MCITKYFSLLTYFQLLFSWTWTFSLVLPDA